MSFAGGHKPRPCEWVVEEIPTCTGMSSRDRHRSSSKHDVYKRKARRQAAPLSLEGEALEGRYAEGVAWRACRVGQGPVRRQHFVHSDRPNRVRQRTAPAPRASRDWDL